MKAAGPLLGGPRELRTRGNMTLLHNTFSISAWPFYNTAINSLKSKEISPFCNCVARQARVRSLLVDAQPLGAADARETQFAPTIESVTSAFVAGCPDAKGDEVVTSLRHRARANTADFQRSRADSGGRSAGGEHPWVEL